ALEVLPMIIKYMNRYIEPDEKDQLQIPKVIILCLSFIWNQIACCEDNAAKFVKMGGVYLILDVAGCLPVQLVALGALIDLCESTQCIPYLITWRKHGQGIQSLLLQVFRDENELLDVRTDENGIISNSLHPLVGMTQFYETYCMCQKHVGNAAIGDMFISCRPKIYSLLQILNHKQKETVEIANEFYKVTYVLADNYLALKLGEEWKEIEQDFKKMNMRPILLDAKILKDMSEVTDKWGKDVQQMQKDVVKKHHMKQHQKEQILYKTMRESRLSDAWESLCEMKYIARCSERLFRITSNFNIQAQINRSLQVDQSHGQMHRTFPSNISISCMQNQHITIRHEAHEEMSRTTKPIMVSPTLSETSVPDEDTNYLQGEYPVEGHLKCSSHVSEETRANRS
ncbi:hypothetical protein HUJ05_003948, partial [Dendroctonus ponderosae]